MVAEEHADLAAFARPSVRTIEGVHTASSAQGAVEDAAVCGGPLESRFGGEPEDLVRNRAFRRPKAHGRGGKLRCGELAWHLELTGSVTRVPETPRQRDAGMRNGGDVGIAEQRQNRMIVGRGRNLDLPGLRSLMVSRYYQPQNLLLLFEHQRLVSQVEVAAFADQRQHAGIVFEKFFIEPGQLRKHLQVAKVLSAERQLRIGGILLCAPGFVQLRIAWEAINHPLRVSVEEMIEDQVTLDIRKRVGRRGRALEKRV